MQLAIFLQFSGSAKEYAYAVGHLRTVPQVGDRVVIPNKVKDDGTLSLSIGTVTGDLHEHAGNDLLPVIQIISKEDLFGAGEMVKAALAAKEVAA